MRSRIGEHLPFLGQQNKGAHKNEYLKQVVLRRADLDGAWLSQAGSWPHLDGLDSQPAGQEGVVGGTSDQVVGTPTLIKVKRQSVGT